MAWYPTEIYYFNPYTDKIARGDIASFSDSVSGLSIKLGKFNFAATQASGTPTPSSPIPISGVTGLTTHQGNKNLVQTAPPYGATTACIDFGRDITVSSITFSFLATNSVVQATNAAFVSYRKDNGTNQYKSLGNFADANGNKFVANTAQNGRFSNTNTNITFRYLYVYYLANGYSKFASDSLSDWQLEIGSSSTSYEAKSDTTYAFTFGDTYYGGYVLVKADGSVELWKDHEYIASYDGETIAEPWISSEDVYVSGTTPTTGAQVVYPITPVKVADLSAVTMNALLGVNNIWCDTGNSEVTYRSLTP